ncbi:hypothetical protein QBC32DRAFT_408241 [Pseudoneurospora amorphoporcata]|uniref:Carrier domain-containing protein n=1 Tax=Pseudoneurospora amorphoporcata TaxID=241081 RepID=A0AAN6SCV3_9PEZI|nr:hypothetical protein QBC32DRAFT_408241 [Pseudoneurospora amorphoporcata]
MSQQQNPPYGRRLILDIIKERAHNEPNREWMSIPRSSDPKDGWKTLTYLDAFNGINRIAHKLTRVCGTPAPNSFPTVAYIGPSDIRYIVFALGAVKAGFQALFISARNSAEGQLFLFEQTNCNVLAFDKSYKATVQPWLHEREMTAILALPVDEWFPADQEDFPYNKTFEEAEWDPLMVLHTSGSTGLPKPVVARQGMLAIADKFRNLPPSEEGKLMWCVEMSKRAKRMMHPMPLYHAAAMYVSMFMTHYLDTPGVLGLGDRPLSSDLVLEYIKYADVQAMTLPPAILEELSQEDEAIQALSKLSFVAFGGGNLAPEAGDRLVDNGVTLCNLISATEFTPFPYFWQYDRKLWRYFHFDNERFGIDWRPHDGDSSYEQVIVRKDKNPGFQGFFYTFPDSQEYSTKDLYKPHPTVKDHWIYQGRADNIIVFSNGEKLNPVTIEEAVQGHPKVKGALVVGTNRFQPALIIEPVEDPATEEERKALLDAIWPTVVRANKETVAHGQIGRQYVALSTPGKPFLRAGKGTVLRPGTISLYKAEIDKIYEDAEEVAATGEVPRLDLSSADALILSLEKLFETSLNAPKLEADTDFFTAGIDSMQTIAASRLIRQGLSAAGVNVDASALATRVIYGNPTPKRLANYLLSVVRKDNKDATHGTSDDELHAMEALVEKYTQDLPTPKKNKPDAADEGQVVVITGTTGAIGSYMIDICSHSPRVSKIICLNRSEDGKARQTASSSGRGLSTDFSKCEFYHADMSRADLGLEPRVYARMLSEVDRIIHNQWPVNFNLSVESFEPHIRGCRNLVDFSYQADKNVPIVFVSTIATVDHWPHVGRVVPEEALDDLAIAAGGYGQSKLVSSLILDKAAEVSGVPTEIVRVGQVCGPSSEQGYWNKQEWLPSIVASSVYLGILPDSLGQMTTVDWTPIEGIANLLLEVGGVTSHVPTEKLGGYFHGVNPERTTWGELAPAVQEYYGDRIKKIVPLGEWIEALEKSQEKAEDVTKNPAIKLLDTYKAWLEAAEKGTEFVELDMERTKSYSKTMKEMKAVTPELMKNWCRQWNY